MERVVVIANPVASQFTGGSHRDVMAELAKTHDVDALWPGSATEATEAARRAVEDGADIVVAMGGDGMVHHVGQGLIGANSALGIIPSGTTNVVARLLDVPQKHAKAAKLIGRSPEPKLLGTVRLTLQRGELETVHHALFACGLGLDAEVVRVADSDPYRKYRFGSLHYARSAFGVGLKDFPGVKPHVDFESGDRTVRGTSALVQFREVYTYFGRIPLRFKDSPPQPMSALLAGRLKRRRIPSIFFSAVTHREMDKIEGFEVWEDIDSFGFEADPPVSAQADGEGLGLVDGGSVEWVGESLRVISGS